MALRSVTVALAAVWEHTAAQRAFHLNRLMKRWGTKPPTYSYTVPTAWLQRQGGRMVETCFQKPVALGTPLKTELVSSGFHWNWSVWWFE